MAIGIAKFNFSKSFYCKFSFDIQILDDKYLIDNQLQISYTLIFIIKQIFCSWYVFEH